MLRLGTPALAAPPGKCFHAGLQQLQSPVAAADLGHLQTSSHERSAVMDSHILS
jgi:hypothetical protein